MPSGCVHILTSSISTTTSRARVQQRMTGDHEYLNKALRHELTAVNRYLKPQKAREPKPTPNARW